MEIGLSSTVWEKMAQLSPDMFCAFDRAGRFVKVSDASRSILGYGSGELVGSHYAEFLHPDYVLTTQEAVKDILNGSKTSSFENYYIHKNGSIVAILWSAVWSEEDEALFCVARDITELKSNRLRLEESQQLYKTLFNNNPDIIFIQDKEGFVLEVNQSFCNIFGISREESEGRLTTSFLPPEMVPLCVKNFQECLLGSTTRYDLDIITANDERRTYDVIKLPIYNNGEVTYIKTILKDITDRIQLLETTQRQASKLNTIFESITDGFFTLDKSWNITYLNSEAERLLRLNREHHIGKNILQLFPEEVGGEFHSQYLRAYETGEAAHFISHLKEVRLWLRVKAFPSAEGLSVYFDDITNLVISKQELEKLSLVASKTTNGVIISNRERRIEWVNEGFTKLTGYNLEEVIGKIPFEFLHCQRTDVRAFELAKEVMIDGKPVSFESLNQRKSGEELWLSIQVNPLQDENGTVTGYVIIQTDITERIKSQQQLEKLSLVASKTNNGVLIADKDWKIEWVNEGFTKLTGYSVGEAVGKEPTELLKKNRKSNKAFDSLEAKLLKGESISFEELNVKKNGEEVWVSVDVSGTLNENGELQRFVEVHTDITALKKSELELTNLARDLYRRTSDLQQFTYIVSHNLRAPVANALGLVNILSKVDKDSDLYDTTLSGLAQSVRQLDSVLKDINSILSIHDSKGTLELEPVNVNTIIKEVLSSLTGPIQSCRGEIVNELAENLSLRANRAYLYSIFYNLLTNAIKYRSEERLLKVTIKSFGNPDKGAIISFSDNGTGFDMEKAKDKVFKLYKRFHTDKKGRGIGLYLVKAHLEALGGLVEVSSQVGKGTRFLIYLPKN